MKKIFAYLFIFFVVFVFSIYAYADIFFEAYKPREIVFFVNNSFGGIGSDHFYHFIYRTLVPSFLIVFVISLVFEMLMKILYVSKRKEKEYIYYLIIFFGFIFIENMYMYNKKFNLWSAIFNPVYGDFYEKYFVKSSRELITFPEQKKNLIIVSVESMEKTYSNKEHWGASLIEDLESVEDLGVSFFKYQDGFDTAPTEPSIMALFNGLPASYYSRFHLKKAVPFKESYSLGKILADNGYYSMSIVGSDGNFTGFHHFLDNHGVQKHIDKNDIKKIYPKQKTNIWGYSDKILFDVVQNTIEKIEKTSPFFILIKTVDTHGDDLEVEDYEKKFNYDYYDTINNASKIVANFIKWFKDRPEYQNTLLVVVGDHLRYSTKILFPKDRQIYNLFINSAIKPKNTNRTFTQIDMFPTILEAMGAKVKGHRLGLGTSVFSDEPTLAERFSPEYLAEELAKRSKIYEALW